MEDIEYIVIIVGSIALVLLVIMSLWYFRGKKHHSKGKIRNKKEINSQKLSEEPTYTSNERLDGARVSHRRDHPDRISEEMQLKQKRESQQENAQIRQDRDRKNKMLLVYSPCNAEILTYNESLEEAKKDGYDKPGVLLTPNDDKVYAPINGRVCWDNLDDSMVKIVAEDGTEVMLQCKYKEDSSKRDILTMKVSDQVMVMTGEILCRFQNGIIRNNNKTVQVRMEIGNYMEGQLLMIKRVNYLSHGDKAMTLRL